MSQDKRAPSAAEKPVDFNIVEEDKPRYKPKGYGKVVAALITLAYIFVFPTLLKHLFTFLLERYTVKQVYMMIGIGVHTGVYFLGHIIMYFIYKAKIPFFERYRIITSPWPWESDPAKWRVLLKETLQTTFLAHFVIVPYLVYNDTKGDISFNFNMDQMPTVVDILLQILFCSIIEDTWFYWGHRILHHPWLYPYIHKKHHSYTITISIAAEHLHIVEYFFVSILSTSVGPLLLGNRMHVITYVVYMIFRIVESLNAHCGYDFSWSPYGLLPGCQPSSWHNFHHSHNMGNYSGGFWDYICGTHKPYLEYKKKLEAKRAKEGQTESKKSQ